MYLVIDNRTGAIVSRTSTIERAQARIDALVSTWVWNFDQLDITLAAA